MHIEPAGAAARLQPVASSTVGPSIIMNALQGDDERLAQIANASDPFEGSGEPTIYMSDNRMPVMVELSSTIIYIIFAALLLALVSILPGIRGTKMTSFLGLVTIILAGASILLSIEGSYWLNGELRLHEVPYGALTSETITGKLQVNIGLTSTNVSLVGRLMGVSKADGSPAAGQDGRASGLLSFATNTKLVDYNERFHWDRPDRMAHEHLEALRRGLPYPILTVTEYLSQDSDGFNWMRQLRRAGYFTSLTLYVSLASWCLTAIIMCALPVYLPLMMQITGALLMSSVWIYTLLVQSPKSFVIQLGEYPMEFTFGYTYVMTFIAGAMCMFSGVLLFICQMNKPNEQLTVMDCEQFSSNQKSLGDGTDKEKSQRGKVFQLATPKFQSCKSVVIPIADIEEKFSATAAGAKLQVKK